MNISAVETITKTFDSCIKCCSPVFASFVRFAPHNNKISESIKLQMSAHSNVLFRIKYAHSVSLTRWKRECVRWQQEEEMERKWWRDLEKEKEKKRWQEDGTKKTQQWTEYEKWKMVTLNSNRPKTFAVGRVEKYFDSESNFKRGNIITYKYHVEVKVKVKCGNQLLNQNAQIRKTNYSTATGDGKIVTTGRQEESTYTYTQKRRNVSEREWDALWIKLVISCEKISFPKSFWTWIVRILLLFNLCCCRKFSFSAMRCGCSLTSNRHFVW